MSRKLNFSALAVSFGLFFFCQTFAQGNPSCQINVNGELKRVHVWYTFSNLDAKYAWFMQVANIYENNIGFVDENCHFIDPKQKIEIPVNALKKIGMVVLEEKSFQSIYSFIGVRNDDAIKIVPNKKTACLFVVAPYGPGQMDRTDWKLNNSDCFATDYGTKIYFK
ncbi:hypothetical protein QEJ31_13845 [Pigmentibacter sp. JX0631]|uniref:hypothetical protein n=1 Tax=Pigmentibacter sp. JX0631 TaxID=2976982 RepID=UPI0024686AEB|nr:hypothetical protein [Pigmentibacter sp. JX0631]WGL59609.1 hypothetical protein QEJ31_13845 [Pigmentibacter sp. JX0631]